MTQPTRKPVVQRQARYNDGSMKYLDNDGKQSNLQYHGGWGLMVMTLNSNQFISLMNNSWHTSTSWLVDQLPALPARVPLTPQPTPNTTSFSTPNPRSYRQNKTVASPGECPWNNKRIPCIFHRSFVRLCSFFLFFILSFFSSFICLFVLSSYHWYVLSFIRSFVRSFIRTVYIRSYIHLFIRQFTIPIYSKRMYSSNWFDL